MPAHLPASNAARATVTARSTSPAVASGTSASFAPVAGLKSSYVAAESVAVIPALYPFENRRYALADADAHRREAIAPLAAAQFVQQRGGDARAAGAERMPERNRSAVHVRLGRVDIQVPQTRDRLRGERFVNLHQIHVAHLQSGAFERPAAGGNGTESHH